jgi:predicted CXXCH cytochrome family protein
MKRLALLIVLASPAALAEPPRFVGSAACLRCHSKQSGWQHDWHARALAPATAASVVGKFGDVHFEGTSTDAWMRTASPGRFSVRTQGADGKAADFRVDWVLGGKRMQDPVTVFPDGRWQVLPAYYHVTGAGEWVDYTEDKQGKIGPDHPFYWANFRRTANRECLDCHATGVDVAYDPARRRWRTHLAEPGVACEACHGPGARHAASQDAGDIVNPKKLPPDRALALCGSCHGPRNPVFPLLDLRHRFQPGGAYDDSYTALVVVDGTARSGDFFADGRPKTSSYEYQALVQSRCWQKGNATCITCHGAPHDANRPGDLRAAPDETCRGCHAPVFAAGKAHTHHEKAGCVDCHMPPIVTGVHDRFPDHALDVPAPLVTARHGVPNACNQCHADESPDKTRAALAKWWPGAAARQARRVRLADALDENTRLDSATPLAEVVADAAEAPTLRGAAAVLLAQRFGDAATILPLLRDASSLLRRRGAEALGYTRAPKVAADALAEATRDASPAVRVEATLALARLGDVRMEEAARRLAADPATAAMPQPHFLASVAAAKAGDRSSAIRELERVISLTPYNADALVGLAGLAEQAGDRRRARALLQEALRFAPDHLEARTRLNALAH